jgi:hypothetical protein
MRFGARVIVSAIVSCPFLWPAAGSAQVDVGIVVGGALTGGRQVPATLTHGSGEQQPLYYRERVASPYFDAAVEIRTNVGALQIGLLTSFASVEVDYTATGPNQPLPPSWVDYGAIVYSALLLEVPLYRSASIQPVVYGGPGFTWRVGGAFSGYSGTFRPAAVIGVGTRKARNFRWRIDLFGSLYQLDLQSGSGISTESTTAFDLFLMVGVDI